MQKHLNFGKIYSVFFLMIAVSANQVLAGMPVSTSPLQATQPTVTATPQPSAPQPTTPRQPTPGSPQYFQMLLRAANATNLRISPGGNPIAVRNVSLRYEPRTESIFLVLLDENNREHVVPILELGVNELIGEDDFDNGTVPTQIAGGMNFVFETPDGNIPIDVVYATHYYISSLYGSLEATLNLETLNFTVRSTGVLGGTANNLRQIEGKPKLLEIAFLSNQDHCLFIFRFNLDGQLIDIRRVNVNPDAGAPITPSPPSSTAPVSTSTNTSSQPSSQTLLTSKSTSTVSNFTTSISTGTVTTLASTTLSTTAVPLPPQPAPAPVPAPIDLQAEYNAVANLAGRIIDLNLQAQFAAQITLIKDLLGLRSDYQLIIDRLSEMFDIINGITDPRNPPTPQALQDALADLSEKVNDALVILDPATGAQVHLGVRQQLLFVQNILTQLGQIQDPARRAAILNNIKALIQEALRIARINQPTEAQIMDQIRRLREAIEAALRNQLA